MKFFKFSLVFLINFCATFGADEWYRTASFYQIYPQTFFDGGGGSRTGFGTLRGVDAKLDYIQGLGIDCIWLTPIFESSFNAFGYDITNYEKIDSRYGAESDFKTLIEAIHDRGMKIIVDFVPNHCGYEHEFFKKSSENDSEFANWFVWANGSDSSSPPSNWQRIGGPPKSAWNRQVEDRDVTREEWFYAQFYWNMPDFNLREPEVIAYWQKFLKLWLDFGLDGFRVDAISHGFEFQFPNGTFPDEEVNEGVSNPDDFGYLKHAYTQDQPELFDLIYDWREIFDSYKDSVRIMMTESYSPPETIMKFYRSESGQREGAHLPFNFQLLREISRDSKAKDFVRVINEWFELLPTGEVTNWAVSWILII
jgi:alpha-glucosidase